MELVTIKVKILQSKTDTKNNYFPIEVKKQLETKCYITVILNTNLSIYNS